MKEEFGSKKLGHAVPSAGVWGGSGKEREVAKKRFFRPESFVGDWPSCCLALCP